MANYVVTVLSSLYGWAERKQIIPEGHNPARRIEKFREKRRERFLSDDEFARLGAALREAETIGIPYEVDESRASAKHAPKSKNRRVVVAPDVVAACEISALRPQSGHWGHTWQNNASCFCHPCFVMRLGGVSGGMETQGWRDSSHTAMVGAGKYGSAKLPMATVTVPGKPSFSQ